MDTDKQSVSTGAPAIFDPRTLKKGQQVLWLHNGEVEQGDVLFLTGKGVDVLWLEGYKSRNDTPSFDDILSVYDPAGRQHTLGPFTGKGWLTAAGERYLAMQAKTTPVRRTPPNL